MIPVKRCAATKIFGVYEDSYVIVRIKQQRNLCLCANLVAWINDLVVVILTTIIDYRHAIYHDAISETTLRRP